VPGVGLDAILEHDAPDGLPPREALRLIRPVVATLARLHEPWKTATGRTWHCLYLDLKPSNLIVDPAGRATLLDFGGCQVVIDGVLVLEGGFTRGYAPPECEGPPRVLLPNADVYTVGSTLFQMVTGIHPTDRRGGSREMRLLERKAGSALAGLIGRCLAERPSDRPADARRLGEALDALGG
jgi:serine/threonine protein kinase